MQMDELSSSKQQEQVHLPLNFNASVQQDIHIVYPDRDGYVFCLESGTSASEIHQGCDEESGILVSEIEACSFLAFARKLFGKVSCWLSSTQRVNRSVGGYTGNINIGVQCEVPCGCQPKEAKMGIPESTVSGFRKQRSQDLGLTKTGNIASGYPEKTRYENANTTLKPGWKKPPRPPRAATDPSRQRNMKGISNSAVVRRARLERMRSLRKQKSAEPSSTKASLWALLFTVSFFVIMILQGIFSHNTVSPPQGSSTELDQTGLQLKHKFTNDTSNT